MFQYQIPALLNRRCLLPSISALRCSTQISNRLSSTSLESVKKAAIQRREACSALKESSSIGGEALLVHTMMAQNLVMYPKAMDMRYWNINGELDTLARMYCVLTMASDTGINKYA